MTITEIGNPDDCNDIIELREWVRLLQEMTRLLKEMADALKQKDVCNDKMIEYANKIIEQQEQKITLYQEKTFLLLDRIEKYEVAFSVDSCNDIRRLN